MTFAEATALQVAGRLLAYPDAQFFMDLPNIRKEAISHMKANPEATSFTQKVLAFIDALETMGQPLAAEEYVRIFDLASACSLYMSWHRYGNDRGQGQALAALNGLYRQFGFEPEEGALPDYLPRILEFMALAPAQAQDIMLDGFGPELLELVKNLEEVKSIHAPLLAEALAPLQRDFPKRFASRKGADPTRRPMARPEPEEDWLPCQSCAFKTQNTHEHQQKNTAPINQKLNHNPHTIGTGCSMRAAGEKDE